MRAKHRMLSGALPVVFAGVVAATGAMATETGKREPLVIQEQGSFAVGGTVIKNAGTFDPYKPSPAGQTFHGDHAYVSYQIPVNPRKLPWSSGTAQDNSRRHGKPRRTGVKVSRTFGRRL
jgi:hypothetical protein